MPSFAPVMAIGIVAVALREQAALRSIGDVLAVAAFVVYAVMLVITVRDRRADGPARLSFVAATAVLAALAHGRPLDVVVVVAWMVTIVAGDLRPRGRAPASGGVLLATVASQAAARSAAPFWRPLAIVAFAMGIAWYALRIGNVVHGMACAHTTAGHGDDWIASGGAAITSLAAARIAPGLAPLCWAIAAGWAVVLLAREFRSGIPRYGHDRWSTVFPLGMLSVSAAAAGPRAIGVLARPLAIVALLALAATTAGAARRPRDFRHVRRWLAAQVPGDRATTDRRTSCSPPSAPSSSSSPEQSRSSCSS